MTMCVCAFKFCFAERFAVFSHCFGKIERTILEFDTQLAVCQLEKKMRLRNCDLQYVSTVVIPGAYHIFRINLNDPVCIGYGIPKRIRFRVSHRNPWKGQTCSSMPWWFRNPCCSAGCAASNQSIANVHINYYIIKV